MPREKRNTTGKLIKFYFLIVMLLAILVVSYGVIVPWMMSEANDIMVICALLIGVLTLPVCVIIAVQAGKEIRKVTT
jgi:hypothetical protein